MRPYCAHCGAEQPGHAPQNNVKSPKSIGAAIVLCAIFGTTGVHHFYLGNIVHGLFDLGLFFGAFVLFIAGATSESFQLFVLAMLLIFVDVMHTIIVFYRLITGQQHDGQGRLVMLPGQQS